MSRGQLRNGTLVLTLCIALWGVNHCTGKGEVKKYILSVSGLWPITRGAPPKALRPRLESSYLSGVHRVCNKGSPLVFLKKWCVSFR